MKPAEIIDCNSLSDCSIYQRKGVSIVSIALQISSEIYLSESGNILRITHENWVLQESKGMTSEQ